MTAFQRCAPIPAQAVDHRSSNHLADGDAGASLRQGHGLNDGQKDLRRKTHETISEGER